MATKTTTFWTKGCPQCGEQAPVKIVADRWANVLVRECVQCKADLRVTA